MDATKVYGHCPMGCGQTLFLGNGGHVTCSLLGCPNPTAADQLLAIDEAEHLVVLRETDFRIIHPLRERIAGDPFDMFGCPLHRWLLDQDGPPATPGRYRAHHSDREGWWLEAVDA